MTSKREQVLAAIKDVIASALPGSDVGRNDPLPATIGGGGKVVIHDGDPGDPEILLGQPNVYEFDHAIPVDVLVQKASKTVRATDLDDLLTAMGAALDSDRTLGGLVHYLDWSAPNPDDARILGAAAVKGAVVTLTATYSTTNPLL